MARRQAALAAALMLGVGACSHFRADPPVRQGPIYSPNGEPLSGGPLGDPSCEDAMRKWLARIDVGHVGSIDLNEYMADARRQFDAMDLDKTGVLTPSVLAQYRAPYASGRGSGGSDDEQGERTHRRRDRDDSDADSDSDKGPPRVLERADPVMLADVDLRNRVTRDEFLAYERSYFASLDRNHDGRLDQAELTTTCQPSR